MNKKITKVIKIGLLIALFLSQFQIAAMSVKAELNKVQLKSPSGTAELAPYLGNKESRIAQLEESAPIEQPTSSPTSEPTTEPTSEPTNIPTSTPESVVPSVEPEVEIIPTSTPQLEEEKSDENHDFQLVQPRGGFESNGLVEVEEKRTESTKTYQVDEKNFTVEVFAEPIHKEVEGKFEEIDLNLQTPPATYSLIDNARFATNNQGFYTIDFFSDEQKIAALTNEHGFVLNTKLLGGATNDYRINGNTLQYFNVYDGVDILYSLSSTKVKSDILLTKPVQSNTITEVLEIGALDVQQEGNTLYLKNGEETEFTLSTPYLIDNVGNVSESVSLAYNRISDTEIEVITTFDQEWVNAEGRAYPVAIDPVITPRSSATADVTTSLVRTYGSVPMQWVWTVVGHVAAESGGVQLSGLGRTVVHFNMPNIGADMEVVSAQLGMYRYEARSSDVGINVYSRPYVDPGSASLNFNNSLNGAEYVSGVASGNLWGIGYKTFDITAHTKQLYAGTNKTLVLVASPESEALDSHLFHTEGGANRPTISISYRLAYDVDPAIDINTMDARLRIFSKGLGQLDAVSLDGIAKPKSQIKFSLVELDENGNKLATSTEVNALPDVKERLFFVKPIYNTNPRTGVQNIPVENVNYSTDYIEGTVFDKIDQFYSFKMQVEVGASSNTNDVYSDKFMIHKVKLGETLASLSSYYGVTVDQILFDNNTTDKTIKEDDTLILRIPSDSPRINENDVLPPLMFKEYTAEYKYRGPVCLYGCYAGDPINTGSGNYYHENTDFMVNDYSEISFKRTYNSLGDIVSTSFGNGFSSNYDQFVFYDKNGNLLYFSGDGKVFEFRKNGNDFEKDIDNPYKLEFINNQVVLAEEKTKQKILFDETGSLSKIEEYNGHFTEVKYNDYFQIEKLNIDDAREINFTYNKNNLISEITLPNGAKIQYEYNSLNQMTKFIDAEGFTEEYTYDNQGRITEIIDEAGFSLGRNIYDDKNRVTSQTDGDDKTMTFEYGNKETKVTDADGRSIIYGVDDYNRVTELTYDDGTKQINEYSQDKNELLSITNEKGEVTSYEYNQYGYIIKETDFDGSITEFETDENGNVTHKIYPNKTEEWSTYDTFGNKLSHTDIYGKTETFEYDNKNRMISKTDARGNKEEFTYEGNLIKTHKNKLGLTTTTTYNDLGYVVKEEDNLGRVTMFELDAKGNVTKKTDSYNAIETYVYDGNGNVTNYTDPLGAITEYTYDSTGNLLTATQNGLTETTVYNHQGQKTAFIDSLGNRETYEYDSKNRLIKTTDIRGNESKSIYDDAGNLIESIDKFGNSTKTVVENGLVQKTIDAYGQETSFEYDGSNRIVKTTYPTGEVITNEYDEQGNLVKTISSKGIVTETRFDEYGQIIETIVNGASTKNTYNTLGQQLTKTDALGNTTTYEYDQRGNQVKVIDPLGNETLTVFDNNNRIIETIDAKGNSKKQEYDLKGNVIKQIDELGNETSTIYDIYSRVIEEIDAEGYVTTTKYNHLGQTSEVISARNFITSYAYNQFGDNTTITIDGKVISNKEFDNFGNLVREVTLDSDITTEYNQMNQVIKTLNNGTGLIEDRTYTANGNLHSVSNNAGQTTVYEYDQYNQLIQTTNALNQTEMNEYDAEGQLVRKVGVDGVETTTTYNELKQVIETTSKGITTSYEYDANGNRIKETVGTVSTQFEFDENNRNTKTIDAQGNFTETRFDGKGQVIEQTDKNGNKTHYEYDKNGNETAVIDPLGNKSTKLFDADGNVVETTDALGYKTKSEYNAFNQTTKTVDQLNFLVEYIYNEKQQNIQIIYPYGKTHTFEFAPNNKISKETDSNGASKSTTYDMLGNVLTQTDGNGNVTQYAYDELGRKVKEEKPNGLVIELVYDKFGNLIVQLEDGVVVEQNEYNNYNQQLSSTNAGGQKTTMDYDELGRVIHRKNANGIETHFEYDELNRIVKETINDEISVETTFDANGNELSKTKDGILIESFKYDENNNVTEELIEGVVFNYEYDERQGLIKTFIANDLATTYEYDERGYNSKETDKDGNSTLRTVDYFGNVILEVDRLGNQTKFDYDGEGNIIKVEDPSGRVVNYKVDGNNNTIEKKYSDEKIATSVYDETNNLIEVTDENEFKETYEFDKQGNQTKIVKPDGTTITTEYNELNQVVQITTGSDRVVKVYDEKGNLVKTTNNAGTETRVYDEVNRLIEVVDVNGNHTHYEMDSFDNQTKIVNADGTVITKEYNAHQQLVTVNRNDHLEASYLYDSYGNVSSITQGNGVVVSNTNDIYGRILTKETKLNGTVIEGFKFTYDPENNLLSEEITTPTERFTNTYTYDENNELKTSSKMIDGQRIDIEYNYSVFGNRIQKSRSGDISYVYNEKNQLTSMTTKDGETKYYYDGNGSVRSSIDPNGRVTNYTYDGFNRLIEVNRGKMRITYTYDGNGNRISETSQDTTVNHNSWSETLYTYYTVNQLKGIISKKNNDELFEAMRQQVNAINKNKGCRLISKKQVEEMEISSSSSTTTFEPQTTFFVNDVTSEYTEVLVEKNPSSTSTYSYGKERISDGTNYYQTSRNATVSSTTSQTGEQLETYQYTDYGLEQTPGYGYNGERRDITGLIYLRNRTYDSSTGRFLQLDTYLGQEDSIITQNRSIAFNNNPYKYIDKSGNTSTTTLPWEVLKKLAQAALAAAVVGGITIINGVTKPISKAFNDSINYANQSVVEGLARLYCPPTVLNDSNKPTNEFDYIWTHLQNKFGGLISNTTMSTFISHAISKAISRDEKYNGQKQIHHIVAKAHFKHKDIREKVFLPKGLDATSYYKNLISIKTTLHYATFASPYLDMVNMCFYDLLNNTSNIDVGQIDTKLNLLRDVLLELERYFI